MRLGITILAVIAAVSASSVQFTAAPSTVTLPEESASLKSSELAELNAILLGLTTKAVSSFPVLTSLFSRPRALAVILVEGVDQLSLTGKKYNIDVDGYSQALFDSTAAQAFGNDMETVSVNKNGATGSQLAAVISEQTVDESAIKTQQQPLRDELVQIYRLIAALKTQSAKLSETTAPDVFRVSITGLSGMAASEADVHTAVDDIKTAIQQLTETLNNVYGSQAIVEVVCESAAVRSAGNSTHRISKRAADDKAAKPFVIQMREKYNVSVFTGPDYPAIFAIFAGLIIILSVAVVYIAVGIWNMDPGRDSIIYRMTTTRMKKE